MEDNDLISRNALLELIDSQPILNTTTLISGELERITIPHNCMNCGGKVSKVTGICLYCGTEY